MNNKLYIFTLTIIFLILNNCLKGDDGAFYASGNNLIPLENTSIELKKEYLNLTFAENNMVKVDILFNFYNPGPETELIVGFVTPPAEGAVSDKELNHPHISDFKILFDDVIQDYKIHRMDSSNFSKLSGEVDGRDFIYYFNIKFKSGENIIKHSYKYRGGSSIDGINRFDYRLTTGKTWANGQIDDFYLNIRFNENTYVNIPAYFKNDKLIEWNAYGVSKIRNDINNNKKLKAYFNPGGLSTHIKNFKPDYDLYIDIIRAFPEDIDFLYTRLNRSIETSTNDELRIMKNSIFAFKGYNFKSEDLFEYFSQYAWYFPDLKVKNDINILNENERKLFDIIIKEINKRHSE
jgi:hypothetical protein